MRVVLGLSGDPGRVAVERAVAELRSGRPVAVVEGESRLLVVGVEGLDEALCTQLDGAAGGRGHLVLPPARLRRLGHELGKGAGSVAPLERGEAGTIALPVVDHARVAALALEADARLDAPVRPASALDRAGLELARLALALPAIVAVPLGPCVVLDASIVQVTADALRAHRQAEARAITLVSRAPVPLEGAPDTEFAVFRGGEGLRDQVAVIVGRPDLGRPVPVRLHSACLTGDLFGSLKCDCGDQLRRTVQEMAAGEGGILLYLDQEGRGNGIANKMRAYRLQAQGYDTYDADEVLGFDLDGRRFDFAAAMLRQLGVTRVRALTNNPLKIEALRQAGLEVISEHRVVGRRNAHNLSYLAAKRDRAGHAID